MKEWPGNRGLTVTRELSPRNGDVEELLGMLYYEYIGMYGTPDPNPDGGLDTALGRNGSIVMIAQMGYADVPEEPLGIAGITLDGPSGAAVLRRMFVRWEYRGMGLATRLLKVCEEEARRLGAPRLILETGVTQTSAIALYRSHGYQPVDPFGFYADQPTSVFLGKAV